MPYKDRNRLLEYHRAVSLLKRGGRPAMMRGEWMKLRYASDEYRKSILRKLHANSIVSESGCWEWNGLRDTRDYGIISGFGRQYMAHRISWKLHNNCEIPEGKFILHSCDNPPCWNPAHLRSGTQQENMEEMWSKGRGCPHPELLCPGERNPHAKMTNANVMEIKYLLSQGARQKDLAERFGVSGTVISKIARGKGWRSIPIGSRPAPTVDS